MKAVLSKGWRKGMIVALVILTLFALVAAVGAGYRAYDKLSDRKKTPRNFAQSGTIQPTTKPDSTVQDVESKASQKTYLQPDFDSTETETPAETSLESIVVLPSASQPQTEIPLATSLTVSELVEPTVTESSEPMEVAIESPMIAEVDSALEEQPEHHHDAPSVLEEISQLDHAGERIDRLSKYVEHPASVMRIAVASALGELATRCQGQDLERIIALLNQLSQDVDPLVRVQAASVLGNLQLEDASNSAS